MRETALTPNNSARGASPATFVVTVIGVVVAIGFMLLVDLFLARVDRRESDAHAAEEYSAGRVLLASGHPSDAAVRFGVAVAIDRRNVSYALALAEAMLEEGRAADAEATLRDLLDRAENDGAVNLTMAHVMSREHKTTEAKAYFHRAIFGHWGEDSRAPRAGEVRAHRCAGARSCADGAVGRIAAARGDVAGQRRAPPPSRSVVVGRRSAAACDGSVSRSLTSRSGRCGRFDRVG